MDKLNERIKNRRMELGLTLYDIAQRIGVRDATIQRYESGEIKNIKRSTIIKLSEVLQCTPAYLMGWESDVSSSTDTEVDEYLDSLHKRGEMRMLFSVTKNASKEDIEKAVKIIEALKDNK